MNSQDYYIKCIRLILLSLFLIVAFSLFYRTSSNKAKEAIGRSSSSIIQQSDQSKTERSGFAFKLPQAGAIDLSIRNILVLGRPGLNYTGANLTDTIIIAQLQPENNRAFLISLPRDLLVEIPGSKKSTKINSLYSLSGIKGLEEKIEEITSLPIDRYFIIDLTAAQEIIDLVGGLNVFVPEDIYDPHFPGPGYTYDPFVLKAGWRYLDSRNVLRYVRTRYTSPNGDFDRMARQQQIIRLLKQKVLELNPLWDFPTYLKIFNTLKDNIATDLSILEMKSIWQAAQNARADRITTVVIDKKQTELLTSGTVPFGEIMASVVWPKTGYNNYSQIKDYIDEKINKP